MFLARPESRKSAVYDFYLYVESFIFLKKIFKWI